MKRLLLLTLCLLLAGKALAAEPMREVLHFYENYCASCTPEEDFARDFLALTGLSLDRCRYTGYNISGAAGREALDRARERYGLAEVSLPLVIVDGTVYNGAVALRESLPADALEWVATTDSVILYLYVPACEGCGRALAVLEALPETVTVRRGSACFESAVRIEKIDISAEPAYAGALFAAYGVPDEKRIAPSVFFSDRILSGADDIESFLPALVCSGRASGGTLVPRKEAAGAAAEPQTAMASLGAGLVAGLNTCALSMLLLFLSVTLQAKRRGLLAAVFLLSKFTCYLLIGFVLLTLLKHLNALWLRHAARWTLTTLGLVLALTNVYDALQLRRQRLENVRNQLPTGLRRRLRRAIRALTSRRVLLPAVAVLGFIVAAGEFLCAGQLYLMQLLSAVQRRPDAQALNLILYSAAFVAPSAIICALVLGGRSQARVSAFFAEHMAPVKLITAAAMLAMIIAAWRL